MTQKGADRINVCYDSDISDLWYGGRRGLPVRGAGAERDMLWDRSAAGGAVAQASTEGIGEHHRQERRLAWKLCRESEIFFPKRKRRLQWLAVT
jgi:hypothetical protein